MPPPLYEVVEDPPEEIYDEDFEGEENYDEEPVLELDEESTAFVHQLVTKVLIFNEEFTGMRLHPYQNEFAYRIVESLILNDAEELSGLLSRQSGKTETLADTLSGCMVLFPKLALSFEIMKRFAKGLWVGCFAPSDDQSTLLHGRIVDRLSSERAQQFMLDPEIDDKVDGRGKMIRLKNGSFARRQTANPKAKIEGSSYHIIVVDEAQDVDDVVVRKSIHPMLAAYAGTIVKIGTPGYVKGDFFRSIQLNKRRGTRRGVRQNHFEYDWKIVAKYNPSYGKFVAKEKLRLGEDSDEFQMSYCIKWLLERGQFVTEDVLESMADRSMPLVKSWYRSPCVAGIDVARIKDSTVVTVCWVDWEYPDPFGLREHRILNWLELTNVPWEEQYFTIAEFLSHYAIARCGVDAQGMGSAVAERLAALLGSHMEVVPVPSDLKAQGTRWKFLQNMVDRRMLVFPGHSKARRTRAHRRFTQQMTDVVKEYKQGHMLVTAPDETEAHDDFPDSLAIAVSMSQVEEVDSVEVFNNPFYAAQQR